ncbi:hypothetical protein MRB53_039974 [Persea americana]|nr:hypothetical protein MRB53_039974 [Persea americana]
MDPRVRSQIVVGVEGPTQRVSGSQSCCFTSLLQTTAPSSNDGTLLLPASIFSPTWSLAILFHTSYSSSPTLQSHSLHPPTIRTLRIIDKSFTVDIPPSPRYFPSTPTLTPARWHSNTNGVNGHHSSPKTNGEVKPDHNTEISELWARYDGVKMGDVSKNILFEDLLSRYEYLKQKHADYIQDHKRPGEDSTGVTPRERNLAANVEHLQGLLVSDSFPCSPYCVFSKSMRLTFCGLQNGNPFILILIDGDGLIFRDDLICQGEAGGIEAAAILQQTTVSWAAGHVVECPSDIKVSVRVYAHLHQLAKALSKDQGSLPISLLKAFFQGFSSSPLVDFVDIGPLNYGTEAKLTGKSCSHPDATYSEV